MPTCRGHPSMAQAQGTDPTQSWGSSVLEVLTLLPEPAGKQHGALRAVLIAACNPWIMFYCSLYPPSSSVPYPRPNPSAAGLGILPIKHCFCVLQFSRQFNTRHKHPAGRSGTRSPPSSLLPSQAPQTNIPPQSRDNSTQQPRAFSWDGYNEKAHSGVFSPAAGVPPAL